MQKVFSVNEIISFLEARNFECFDFREDGYAYITSQEAGEITVEAPISEEKPAYITDVLKHLDRCIQKAHGWLSHFSLKRDKWFPDALDAGFTVYGMYFGKYCCESDPDPVTNGFTMTFKADQYYPCLFTVKFLLDDMHPFAVEEWVYQ